MTHLTMEALLALREPGLEPGDVAARVHIDACPTCRAELERLHQRVARLKAMPGLRPSRDLWPGVAARRVAERRQHRARWAGIAGLAAAAGIALAVFVKTIGNPPPADAAAQIEAVRSRSQALEGALHEFNPDARMIDGRTATMSQELEDRIAVLDRRLQAVELQRARHMQAAQEQQMLELWRERVGLLDALVDVHVTRASNVGL